MHDQQDLWQLSLFHSELPGWESIPRDAQQAVLEVLLRMLSQTLQPHDHEPNTTTENHHVS